MSASFIAPSPIARRAENPVPTPKSIRPGASPFRVAKALAVTAARRFDGTSTPVPSRIFEVFTAAAAIETKRVGGDHLRVEEPGMGKAQFLGALRDLPRIRCGRDADAEIHGATLVPFAPKLAARGGL